MSSPPPFHFEKQSVLPSSDPKSPFFCNLPSYESKPIDHLIDFFKYWKYFIKAILYYFKEIALVKELEANLNYQLINAVQFPGFKDLPNKILQEISASNNAGVVSPKNGTPTNELKKTLSNTSIATTTSEKRPGLFKQKSNGGNNPFLKSNPLHKRNSSLTSIKLQSGPPTPPPTQPSGFVLPPAPKAEPTNDVKIPASFFPDDSIYTNFPSLLLSSHHTLFNNSFKLTKELNSKLIPRLEMLLKQLSHKIKEIKTSLKNDSFANKDLLKEISKTGQALRRYTSAVELYCGEVPVTKKYVDDEEELAALDDPLLVKLQVDYRLKNQLIMENYMFASYLNLQGIARDLFTYILKELHWVIDKFGKLHFNSEYHQFLKTKVSNSSTHDWQYFISHNPCFINTAESTEENPKRENRTFKAIQLPYDNSVQNKCIRFGMMYKKSKVMKSYTRCYYVLSCNYLHEFKFDEDVNVTGKKSKDKIGGFIGHDTEPIKSYNLNEYTIIPKNDSSYKFVLSKNNTKSKRTFKCATESDYNNWFRDLSELLKFGSDHYARYSFIQKKVHLYRASTVPEGKAGLKLDLGNALTPALTGMFTPSIRTPKQSPSEDNPFENMLSDIPTHSPTGTPKVLTPEQSSTNLVAVDTQHHEYLKLQNAFLHQQQELLDMKMKETSSFDLIQKKLDKIHEHQSPYLSTKGSSDSLNSFVIPLQAVPAAQQVIDDHLKHHSDKPIVFNLGEAADANAEGSTPPIPTVLISENHWIYIYIWALL